MTRRILLITGLVVLVVFAGWYAGLYRSEVSHVNALKTKEQAAASSLLGLETRYASLVSNEKQLGKQRALLARLSRAVPDGPELDNLVTTLYGAATATGVQLTSIGSPAPANFGVISMPGAAVTPGPYELALSLSVAGTPSEIEHLVRVLDSDPRLFVVDSFSLSFGAGAANPGPANRAAQAQTGTTLSVRAFYASADASSAAS